MSKQNEHELLQPIKNILVCLDLTEVDSSLISYASSFAKSLPLCKLTFIHTIQAYDLPDRSSKKFPQVETELQEAVRESIFNAVGSQFENRAQWEVVTKVGYEDASQEIINYIQEKNVDLTMLGQKYGEDRQARYSQKIAAESNSDILFVSQGVENENNPVFCAIDFSQASVKAFERALDLSRIWDVPMFCYSVSDPTRAYFPASTERSLSRSQQQFQKAFEKMLNSYSLTPDQVNCRIEESEQISNEAESIYTAALEEEAGLIVVGASGTTTKVTSLLGNLCESFRIMEKELPVMIVKHEVKSKFKFWESP